MPVGGAAGGGQNAAKAAEQTVYTVEWQMVEAAAVPAAMPRGAAASLRSKSAAVWRAAHSGQCGLRLNAKLQPVSAAIRSLQYLQVR